MPVLAPQVTVRRLAPIGQAQILGMGKCDILTGTPLSMRPMHDHGGFRGVNLTILLKGDVQDKARPSSYQCWRIRSGRTFPSCLILVKLLLLPTTIAPQPTPVLVLWEQQGGPTRA